MIDAVLLAWSALAAILANALQIAALFIVRYGQRVSIKHQSTHNINGLPELTIVRPLRGLDPRALACHTSLFNGGYQPAKVLFVVESNDDPAIEGVQQILNAYPYKAQLLVSKPAPFVLSVKVRNMITGWEAARTPLIGFCDSDIQLGHNHLAACVNEFADPQVAAVSVPIIYVSDGWLGRMKMLIETVDNATFSQSAVHTGFGTVILGGLMLFRRDDLNAVGGVEKLGDALADDLRAGELLDHAGYKIRLADAVLVHHSGPESISSNLARQHRWLTSIRTEIPKFFWLQLLLLNPIGATLIAGLALTWMGSPWASWAWSIMLASIVVRTITAFAIDYFLLRPYGIRLGIWCLGRLPADIMYLIALIVTLLFPFVFWRGRWFRVKWGSGKILRELGSPSKNH